MNDPLISVRKTGCPSKEIGEDLAVLIPRTTSALKKLKEERMQRAAVTLELDVEKASKRKEAAVYRLNVIQFPLLRVFGFFLLAFFVLIHNYYISKTFSWQQTSEFQLIAFSYAGISWLFLYLFFGKTGKFNLGLFFLIADFLIFALAVYFSGGQKSLLFFIFLIRVADQTNTNFKRVLLFSHISIAVYGGLLLYLHYVDREDIWLAYEIPKMLGLYLACIYISFTARTAERLRNRTSTAMKMARESIGNLEAKSIELKDAKLKAEAGNLAKTEFLANINHEIRTPLSGIMGMIRLVKDSPLNKEQQEHLELAGQSAESLSGILNDILDFTKTDANSIVLENHSFDLRELLNNVDETISPSAQEKGLRLRIDCASEVPDRLMGDQKRMRQILVHLGRNAIKFTREGGLMIRIEIQEKTHEFISLHFMVSDTGIGIPEERLKNVFDTFSQVDGSSTREYGGAGLGLALSSRIVEMMGGSIWVKSPADVSCVKTCGLDQEGELSSLGPGSTFHFVLPFQFFTKESSEKLSDADLEMPSEDLSNEMENQEKSVGKHLDVSKAMEMFDGDMDLFREIAGLFVKEFPDKADQIRDAIKKGDGEGVVQGAQNLKDSAGSLGADEILGLSSRLEALAHEDRLSDVEIVLEELAVAFEVLKSSLKEVH